MKRFFYLFLCIFACLCMTSCGYSDNKITEEEFINYDLLATKFKADITTEFISSEENRTSNYEVLYDPTSEFSKTIFPKVNMNRYYFKNKFLEGQYDIFYEYIDTGDITSLMTREHIELVNIYGSFKKNIYDKLKFKGGYYEWESQLENIGVKYTFKYKFVNKVLVEFQYKRTDTISDNNIYDIVKLDYVSDFEIGEAPNIEGMTTTTMIDNFLNSQKYEQYQSIKNVKIDYIIKNESTNITTNGSLVKDSAKYMEVIGVDDKKETRYYECHLQDKKSSYDYYYQDDSNNWVLDVNRNKAPEYVDISSILVSIRGYDFDFDKTNRQYCLKKEIDENGLIINECVLNFVDRILNKIAFTYEKEGVKYSVEATYSFDDNIVNLPSM